MGRCHGVSARALFLAALGMALLVPALASSQTKPECKIDGPDKANCQAMLCGPAGAKSYDWRGGNLPKPTTSQCVTVTVSGTYTLTFIDAATGDKLQCTKRVFIESCKNQPPDCSGAHPKDDLLWPPNHEMQTVEIEGVTDPDGDPVLIEVYAITQDEPLNVEGDGSTCADAEIVDGVASVRMERTGDPNIPGNGRVYEIAFVASDGHGGKCSGTVKVCVPHDMGLRDTCIDDGQIYDSLGPCPE